MKRAIPFLRHKDNDGGGAAKFQDKPEEPARLQDKAHGLPREGVGQLQLGARKMFLIFLLLADGGSAFLASILLAATLQAARPPRYPKTVTKRVSSPLKRKRRIWFCASL